MPSFGGSDAQEFPRRPDGIASTVVPPSGAPRGVYFAHLSGETSGARGPFLGRPAPGQPGGRGCLFNWARGFCPGEGNLLNLGLIRGRNPRGDAMEGMGLLMVALFPGPASGPFHPKVVVWRLPRQEPGGLSPGGPSPLRPCPSAGTTICRGWGGFLGGDAVTAVFPGSRWRYPLFGSGECPPRSKCPVGAGFWVVCRNPGVPGPGLVLVALLLPLVLIDRGHLWLPEPLCDGAW
ncbi:MAG: hypothetical protein CM15mP77_1700 [Synechococcus sp.]|nr:MAG: hypothetical protein CM15mP77_1700 [Synechococcus sp.]